MYAAPAAVDSRLRGNDGYAVSRSVVVALVLVTNLGSDPADSVLYCLGFDLASVCEMRVWSLEGLDYGRWSVGQRSSIGTHGNPRGGADTLWQVRRRAIPPERPGAWRGGDQGRHRPLRHRGQRPQALHLRYRGAGGGRADSVPPGQRLRGSPFHADDRDAESGVRFRAEERDARRDPDPRRRLRRDPGRRHGEHVERP